jgi:hypothetical protein
MVSTQEQLREHTARRPFAPFWLRLVTGETLFVTEQFRAVVSPGRIVVSPDGRSLRRIPLTEVTDHGLFSPADGPAEREAGK